MNKRMNKQNVNDETDQDGNVVSFSFLVVVEGGDESITEFDEHGDVRHGAHTFAGDGGHQSAGGVAQRLQMAQRAQRLRIGERHQGDVHLFALGHRQGAGNVVGARRSAGDDQDDVTGR